jgi:hypothetical protein
MAKRPSGDGEEQTAGSPHSHDAVFKRTFSVPSHALDLMRQQLPEELVAALDPGSLREESGTFIDDALKETRSDVLYSATVRGSPVLIYVLIEHQSTVDLLEPFRVLRYVVRIWEKWLSLRPKDAGVARALPPVIPFILHQGPRPWDGPRSLAELVPLPAELAAALGPLLPGLQLSILDLGAEGPEALATWQAEPIVKLTLAFMRGVIDPAVDLVALLTAFASELTAIMSQQAGRDAFRVVVGYSARRRRGLDVAALAARASELAGPRAGEVVMSTAQELIDQGVQQGVKQGVPQGERRLLLRLLRSKFGPLSADVEARVAAADEVTLEAWAEAVLTAQCIDDVWTGR